MKKTKYIIIAAAVLALIVFVIIRSCGAQSGTDEEMEMPEETATVERMTIENKISSKGEVVSSLEENLTPHTGWKLKETKAVKGEAIKEGDTILVYTNGSVMKAPYGLVVKEWNLPNKGGTFTDESSITVAGTDVLKMDISVGEDKILDVRNGSPAVVKIKATGGKYRGNVSFVSDVGEYSGGLSEFTVSVTFDNDGKAKLGMNGRAVISLDKAENVLAVPADAVYSDGDTSYVTIKKGDKTKDVEVETGLSNDEYTEIRSGLKEGDEVIVVSSYEDEWDEEIYY